MRLPDGQLVLELHNPARLARLVELAGGTSAMVVEREGDLMVDRVRYDEAGRRPHTERFIVRGGGSKLEFSLEQLPPDHLIARLHRAGFAEVDLFGSDGARFDSEGSRLIARARRRGNAGA